MDEGELTRLIARSISVDGPGARRPRRDGLARAILIGFALLLAAIPLAAVLLADPVDAVLGIALGDPLALMGLGL